jgi:hypothetical protein
MPAVLEPTVLLEEDGVVVTRDSATEFAADFVAQMQRLDHVPEPYIYRAKAQDTPTVRRQRSPYWQAVDPEC